MLRLCKKLHIISVVNHSVNIFSHSGIDTVAMRMRINPVFVALPFYRVYMIVSCSSGRSDDFFSSAFATGTGKLYQAWRTALMKGEKLDDGHVVHTMLPVIDDSWLPPVAVGHSPQRSARTGGTPVYVKMI